jgi:hypothetical protein
MNGINMLCGLALTVFGVYLLDREMRRYRPIPIYVEAVQAQPVQVVVGPLNAMTYVAGCTVIRDHEHHVPYSMN